MEQKELFFRDEERENLKSIVKRSFLAVKKRYPRPVSGETTDEYYEFIKDETLLEIAERLQKIVYDKQNREIAYLRNPN